MISLRESSFTGPVKSRASSGASPGGVSTSRVNVVAPSAWLSTARPPLPTCTVASANAPIRPTHCNRRPPRLHDLADTPLVFIVPSCLRSARPPGTDLHQQIPRERGVRLMRQRARTVVPGPTVRVQERTQKIR